ncbi:MAG: DinB family protein [Gemmatimonadaceae bacterium]
MTSTTAGAPSTQATSSAKQQFLGVYEHEHRTTLRVLRAYPEDKLDLRPHAKCKTARELAWLMVKEQEMIEKALTTGFDWSAPPAPPPAPPATIAEIVDALDKAHRRVVEAVQGEKDEQLSGTVKFFVAPKTMGDVPKTQFIWMMLHDQIHHRGQFSIYLRMADAKVPSIYGPSADEPWM